MSKPISPGICFTTLILAPLTFVSLEIAAAPVEESTVGQQGSVRVLGIDIIPELKMDATHTDNLLKSDTNKISSTHTLIRPSATAHVEHGLNKIDAEIAAEENYFSNTEKWDYNYEAVDTNVKANLDLTPRNRLNLSGQYLLSQENPGEGFSQGVQIRSKNTVMLNGNTFPYALTTLRADYEFGHRDATGRVEVYDEARQYHYSETRALPYDPDRTANQVGGRFHLRLSSKTDLLVGAGQLLTRYNDYTPLDSDEHFWELGASIKPSTIFSFDARAGQTERKLINTSEGKSKAPSYTVNGVWSPLSYSRVSVGATQSFQESSGYGAFSKEQAVNLAWNHDWTSRFATFIQLSDRKETTEAGNGGFGIASNANSKSNAAEAGLSFLQRRWLKWQLSAAHAKRNSDLNLLDYTENLVRVEVLLTL